MDKLIQYQQVEQYIIHLSMVEKLGLLLLVVNKGMVKSFKEALLSMVCIV